MKKRLVDTFSKKDLINEIVNHALELNITNDVLDSALSMITKDKLKKLLISFGDEAYKNPPDDDDYEEPYDENYNT